MTHVWIVEKDVRFGGHALPGVWETVTVHPTAEAADAVIKYTRELWIAMGREATFRVTQYKVHAVLGET